MQRGLDDLLERADLSRALDGVDGVELGGELGLLLERSPRPGVRSKAPADPRPRCERKRLGARAPAGRPAPAPRTSRENTTAAAGPPPITEA